MKPVSENEEWKRSRKQHMCNYFIPLNPRVGILTHKMENYKIALKFAVVIIP